MTEHGADGRGTVSRVASVRSEYPFELLVGESPGAIVGRTPGVVELPDPERALWVRPDWRRSLDVARLVAAAAALPVTRLALRGSLVDDALLRGVATLSGLRALSLEDCIDVSDAGLRALTGLQGLETLELRGMWQSGSYDGGITSAGLESLAALPRLSRIFVSPWEFSKQLFVETLRRRRDGREALRMPGPGDRIGLDDSVARALAGCRSLVSVALHGAGAVTGAGLAELAALPGLEALEIDANAALQAGDLACLRGAGRLRNLYLRNCHGLADAAVIDVGALTQLETLTLQFSGLTDAGIDHLRPLQRLHTLDLFFNHGLTERSLDALETLGSLASLNLGLAMDTLADAGVARLAQMQRLAHLELGYMARPLTDAGLAALGRCPQLETLTLGSGALTDAGVRELVRARRLRRLELWNPLKLGDASLTAVGELPSLTSLWLGDIGAVSARGLDALARLPGLTTLGLRARGLTDDGLRALARAPALRSLFLDDCAEVTDEGIAALAAVRTLRSLRVLSLAHHPSPRITDRGLRALASLPRLVGVDLRGVAGATHSGFLALSAVPSLVKLETPWLSPEHDRALREGLAAHPWKHAILDRDAPWPE